MMEWEHACKCPVCCVSRAIDNVRHAETDWPPDIAAKIDDLEAAWDIYINWSEEKWVEVYYRLDTISELLADANATPSHT